MKLGRFHVDGQNRIGIVSDNGIIDLTNRVNANALTDLFAKKDLKKVRDLSGEPPDFALDAVKWLVPIEAPRHIIGIGLNTRSHFEETAQLMKRVPGDYPVFPRLFMRSPDSLAAHNEDLVVPKVSHQLDYEGEIAIIIGEPGRYISEETALSHVVGFTCSNDGSVRDFQQHSNQVTAGKNFQWSGSIGPSIKIVENASELESLRLSTTVNGEVRQQLRMDDLIFSFARLIAYISQIYPLATGDIILTGSPAGIGALKKLWLRSGDILEIAIEGMGVLRNTVRQEV